VLVKIGDTLQDEKCPSCSNTSLQVVMGMVGVNPWAYAKPWTGPCMSMRMWPLVLCKDCGFEEFGKVSSE
jgi:hypothetical protein